MLCSQRLGEGAKSCWVIVLAESERPRLPVTGVVSVSESARGTTAVYGELRRPGTCSRRNKRLLIVTRSFAGALGSSSSKEPSSSIYGFRLAAASRALAAVFPVSDGVGIMDAVKVGFGERYKSTLVTTVETGARGGGKG